MSRRKCPVVLTFAVLACSLISYLVVRALAAGNEHPRVEPISGTAPRDDAAAAAAFNPW
jgi:hypothetical protein